MLTKDISPIIFLESFIFPDILNPNSLMIVNALNFCESNKTV